MSDIGVKISVVMAVYNTDKYLNDAIRSILGQTFSDFEFIIINDASTDDSLKIINFFASKDNRIIIINNSTNKGVASVRNAGLKIAKGKYIAIFDSDDWSFPDRLEKQFTFLEENQDIFLVGSGALNIDSNGAVRTVHRPITDPKLIETILATRCCIYHPTIFFRNTHNIFYREKAYACEDYDLYLRLLTQGKKLSNLPGALIKYRIHESSVSKTSAGKQTLFAKKILDFYKQRLEKQSDEYDSFDPETLKSLGLETLDNKKIVGAQIEASFKLNNFKKTRLLCKEYFKLEGVFNKYTVYFVSSFLSKKTINFLRYIFFS